VADLCRVKDRDAVMIPWCIRINSGLVAIGAEANADSTRGSRAGFCGCGFFLRCDFCSSWFVSSGVARRELYTRCILRASPEGTFSMSSRFRMPTGELLLLRGGLGSLLGFDAMASFTIGGCDAVSSMLLSAIVC
jgi:hypothetical protein